MIPKTLPHCLTPPPLRPGDKIAVVAPAGPVAQDAMAQGMAMLSEHFVVQPGSSCLKQTGYFAGGDDERLADLVQALQDPTVGAVIAARGGYGTTRLLDRIDYGSLGASPKWIVGCSDLTALLLTAFVRAGLATIHGPMAAALGRTDGGDVDELWGLLGGKGGRRSQELTPVRLGTARGPVVGGNLTVLAHLVGTLSPSCLSGAIVLLEDVGEAPYRLNRCLVQLRRAGWLDTIQGLVVGELWDCGVDRYGVSAVEALLSEVRDLGVPSAYGYPAAHGRRNRPFVHGMTATLEVYSHGARLVF